MSEIHCPGCGKLNPADQEFCQFCHAAMSPMEPEPRENEQEDELTQWFSEEVESELPGNHAALSPGDEVLDFLSTVSNEGDLPAWLLEANAMESEDISSLGQEPKDWIKFTLDGEDQISDSALTGSEQLETSDQTEPGGWLPEIEALSDASSAQDVISLSSTQENPNGLSPSSLPGWLEALRPAEPKSAAGTGEADSYKPPETSGPLAGLRGVIPAEPNLSSLRKLPAYSVKLQVTDAQQAHTNILEQLVQAEGLAEIIPRRFSVSSQDVLRLVFAGFLILVTVLSVLIPVPDVQTPTLLSFPGAMDAYQMIDNLATAQPVLVAVDYPAGASGEMDMVTGAVLHHLMERRARLVFVSTHPTGSMQAERIIQQANPLFGNLYLSGINYANLGFVPGGHIGLLGLAQDIRKTLPVTTDGIFIWQIPAFQWITRLEDFAMVIVATENSDTARYWIEQVQPLMDKSALIMAVSAQVEPVLMPYYYASTGQIQGVICGAASAAAYEAAALMPGKAYLSWRALSYAGLAAVVLIIFGGGLNAFIAFNSNRKRSKLEGEKKP